ncbi:iron-siderophore ABC transporter substrate-binding protein [Chlorogloeopsis sp. ULAP01]|uniref:iron-siderophore ABC transporter substrate-binding protein n=1 Tax=Chlorogloeopsis sp. ULAP01 TaxID=3056483 RepID=UPI0025AAD5F4|nr:iron-siderophore ABC transporter substrate-binding protein [Chlorogloeopsis sp. ULAP01]MDM9382403.1 iron-siderophore ABC transporter substrate-binding protein [Chlorogloeopsis sp. ULAP01]
MFGSNYKIKHIIYYLVAAIAISLISACRQSFPNSALIANCRMIQHAVDKTCVPHHPQRIIVLDTNPLDGVLALGIKPIAAPDFSELSLPEEMTQGIISIGNNSQPNLEEIARLNPDLIIGLEYSSGIYKQLTQIAPTILAPGNEKEWKEDLRLYALALNKTQEAEAILQAYNARIKEFRQRMHHCLKTKTVSLVSTIRYGAGKPAHIYLSNSFMGAIIAEAGLKRPPAQTTLAPTITNDNWGINISIERLDLIDGDVIFAVNTKPETKQLDSTLSQLQQHPLWSKLDAVKNNRVYTVNYMVWVAQRNVGGANRILDDLFKYLVNE